MELFKERLSLALYFVLMIIVIFALTFVVFLPVFSLAILKPYIMIIVLSIGVVFGIGYLIYWLFIEPFKKEKNNGNFD